MQPLARVLVLLGLFFLIAGGLLTLAGRANLPLGRLPGDIHIERGNFSCSFPLMTSIVVSVLLTILLNLAARFLNK